MQIENVARVRFATWRTPQEQGDFAVRLRMLRQVVINAQSMAAAVAEILAHGACGIWSDVKKRRRVGCACRNDDAVAERIGFFENAHDLRDRRLLLADGVVDADDVFVALIDDRVHRNCGLAGLAVADDQLALSAADRHHRIDGFETCLQRLAHWLAIDDARRNAFDWHEGFRRNGTLAVDRLAERIDDAAEQLFADRHGNDAARALYNVTFFDFRVLAEEHGANAVFFEIQRDAKHAVRKLEHLAGHGTLDAVHARDAVAERHDAADFGDVDFDGVAANLVADDLGNFFSLDVHVFSSFNAEPPGYVVNLALIFFSCVAILASYTVLPTRATTPPMMSLSTFVVMATRLPVTVAKRFSMV